MTVLTKPSHTNQIQFFEYMLLLYDYFLSRKLEMYTEVCLFDVDKDRMFHLMRYL